MSPVEIDAVVVLDDITVIVDPEVLEVTVEEVVLDVDDDPDVVVIASGNIGPVGPQGEEGEQGPEGPQGLQGPVGAEASFGFVDAAGDLIVGSADDLVDNLAVGTDGQVLAADSSRPLKMKWTTLPSGAVTLDGLLDVDVPTPNDEDVLSWDMGAGTWTGKQAVLDVDYDAKGDIIVGSGHYTNDRLPSGTPGQIIVADPTAAVGLKYSSPPILMILALWQGYLPQTIGFSSVWRVPYLDDSARTFAMSRSFFRVEVAGSANARVVIEKSNAGVFTPSDVDSLILIAGTYEIEHAGDPGDLGTLVSGQLLRVSFPIFTGFPSSTSYTIELEGQEAA